MNQIRSYRVVVKGIYFNSFYFVFYSMIFNEKKFKWYACVYLHVYLKVSLIKRGYLTMNRLIILFLDPDLWNRTPYLNGSTCKCFTVKHYICSTVISCKRLIKAIITILLVFCLHTFSPNSDKVFFWLICLRNYLCFTLMYMHALYQHQYYRNITHRDRV